MLFHIEILAVNSYPKYTLQSRHISVSSHSFFTSPVCATFPVHQDVLDLTALITFWPAPISCPETHRHPISLAAAISAIVCSFINDPNLTTSSSLQRLPTELLERQSMISVASRFGQLQAITFVLTAITSPKKQSELQLRQLYVMRLEMLIKCNRRFHIQVLLEYG
jgi:hypothetical protein